MKMETGLHPPRFMKMTMRTLSSLVLMTVSTVLSPHLSMTMVLQSIPASLAASVLEIVDMVEIG